MLSYMKVSITFNNVMKVSYPTKTAVDYAFGMDVMNTLGNFQELPRR